MVSVDVERGMANLTDIVEVLKMLKIKLESIPPEIDFYESRVDNQSETMVDTLLELANSLYDEYGLRVQTGSGNYSKSKIDLSYFVLDFSKEYFQQIRALVHNKCYSTSFVSFPKQTVMWSHYAGNHTGACLIFKADVTKKDKPSLTLKDIGNNSVGGLQFEKIDYSGNKIPIDFFRSLFTLNKKTLITEWYTDEFGNKSVCEDILTNLESKRIEYWDKICKIHTLKKHDWMYEDEYRIVLYDTFSQYTEQGSRTFKYNFEDLDGIIFGINTPANKKIEMIRIVYEKCVAVGHMDFKFFQARYNENKDEVVFDELSQMHFKRK